MIKNSISNHEQTADSPLVSIILPVYNAEQYLNECLKSLLKQTYTNLELVIINDGSKDSSSDIIKKYLNDFANPVVVERENKGLVSTLNEAISLSKGEFIARMDADDIATSDRIEKQITFLLNNPEISACGTAVKKIDAQGKAIGHLRPPIGDTKVLIYSLFRSPIIHPTIVLRRNCIQQYKEEVYSSKYIDAEDYELWVRLLISGHKISNIKDVGLLYRVHEQSITNSRSSEMKLKACTIKETLLNYLTRPNSCASHHALCALSTRIHLETNYDGDQYSPAQFIKLILLNIGKSIYRNYGISGFNVFISLFWKFFISYYAYSILKRKL